MIANVRPPAGYSDVQRLQLFDALRQRLTSLPGVSAVAYSQVGQLSGFGIEYPIHVKQLVLPPADTTTAVEHRVSTDFFAAMGTPLLLGRRFTDSDDAGATPVAIVNESFARRFLQDPNPIGRHFDTREGDPSGTVEIMGVVKDTNWFSLRHKPSPMYYRPFRQVSTGLVTFAVRATGNLDAVAQELLRSARTLAPGAFVENVSSMNDVVDRTVATDRMAAYVSCLFGLLATVIACIGIYGVLSYDVALRTQEIGVRMALGAQRSEVMGLILRQGSASAIAGIVLGLAAAAAVTRYLDAMLFDLTPLDPATFAGVAVMFASVATLASYVPARRATRVDPLTALRSE